MLRLHYCRKQSPYDRNNFHYFLYNFINNYTWQTQQQVIYENAYDSKTKITSDNECLKYNFCMISHMAGKPGKSEQWTVTYLKQESYILVPGTFVSWWWICFKNSVVAQLHGAFMMYRRSKCMFVKCKFQHANLFKCKLECYLNGLKPEFSTSCSANKHLEPRTHCNVLTVGNQWPTVLLLGMTRLLSLLNFGLYIWNQP